MKNTNKNLVWVKSLKKKAEIISKDVEEGTAIVSIIVSFDRDTQTRTTQAKTVKLSDIAPYKPKHKKYNPNEMYWMVRDFQKAFNHPVSDKPTMLTKERIEKRNKWVIEELEELLEAETVVDQADACIDALYFLFGNLVEMGVKPFNLFKIVQEANMGKLWEDGKPRYREEDGKVKKPPHWEEKFAPEPRLKAEIDRQSK